MAICGHELVDMTAILWLTAESVSAYQKIVYLT